MQTISTIDQALDVMGDYLDDHGASLEPALRDRLKQASREVSRVVGVVSFMEVLYAHRDEVGDAGKLVCAQLAQFATVNAWHGLAADNRGAGIVYAMRRDLGHTNPANEAWPDPADDPEPDSQHAAGHAHPAAALHTAEL